MSTQSNPYSQGGGGNTFELDVQTAFFISFLLGGELPGLPMSHITHFRQQTGSLGYATDDVLLRCTDDLVERRVLFQIKHQITATADNDMFKDVVTAAWKDFNNADLFNTATDRIYLVTSVLPVTVKSHLLPVLSWAKAKNTLADYLNEVNRNEKKKRYYDIFKKIIKASTPTVSDDDLFRFFKCYKLLAYDLDETASVTRAGMITTLMLAKETTDTPISIWNEVYALLAGTNSKAGEYTLEGRPAAIIVKLKKAYLSDVQKTLRRLSARSLDLLEVITDRIGSCHLNRSALLADATSALSTAQVLIFTGEAGAGKSALAKKLVAQSSDCSHGYTLAFKADELLTGQLRDWFDQRHIDLEIKEIFSHFGLLPNAVVYVDGMERLLEEQAEPFKQLLIALRSLPTIKLVGSCRKSLLTQTRCP